MGGCESPSLCRHTFPVAYSVRWAFTTDSVRIVPPGRAQSCKRCERVIAQAYTGDPTLCISCYEFLHRVKARDLPGHMRQSSIHEEFSHPERFLDLDDE